VIRIAIHIKYRDRYRLWKKCIVTPLLVTFENQSSIIYWFLLRYTVIIYKFTQGNLGAKKTARSRFQSPVKKKKSQIATLVTDSAIPGITRWLSTREKKKKTPEFLKFVGPRGQKIMRSANNVGNAGPHVRQTFLNDVLTFLAEVGNAGRIVNTGTSSVNSEFVTALNTWYFICFW
jgi:hypothetical protein